MTQQKGQSNFETGLNIFGKLFKINTSVKISVISILALICIGITYYFQWILGVPVVFTHFFYLPIALTAFWWGRKGIWMSVFLAIILLVSHSFSGLNASYMDDIIRSVLFILVGAIIGSLSQESRRREEALELSRKELDQILNTTGGGIRVVDKDFNTILVNDTFLSMLGSSKDKLIGKKCYEYFGGSLCHTPDCTLKKMINGQQRIECEVQKERSDGIKVPCILTCAALRGLKGEFLGIVEDFRDITERIKLEEKTKEFYEKEKRQREELEEEAKVRIRFIDVLAHELRGPITPIIISAGMLKDLNDMCSDQLQKKLTDNIYHGLQTLAKRLEELLDLARKARGTFTLKLESTDINKFIEEVVSRFKPSIDQQNQHIVLELQDQLPSAPIDPSRFEQVLINLLSNASKYSPEGSRIILNTSIQNGHILIQVKDEGIGISPEDQKNLFQPYQRVGENINKSKGLGLGLAVVKQIVEAHGGKIWVMSQPGKGSTFSFFIPLKDTL
jgi:PAS domain S-box-containing protein